MGLGEVYIRRAEKDSDFYEQSIHHLTEALEISRAKKGSKFLSKKEEAEVLYLRGYARTKLFESSRSLLSISSLGKASNDFKESLELAPKHSPIYYSAKRSWQKVVDRLNPISSQNLAESAGRFLIVLASLTVFGFAQVEFFDTYLGGRQRAILSEDGRQAQLNENQKIRADLGKEIQPENTQIAQVGPVQAEIKSLSDTQYSLLTFGSLMFLSIGLYLPQILKLKVAGIELEKNVIDQIQRLDIIPALNSDSSRVSQTRERF